MSKTKNNTLAQVLVIGGGGREHALAWKLSTSPEVRQVFVAPGNAGTALEPSVTNIDIAADDYAALVDFARSNNIDLTIIGPEQPLADGLVDMFRAQNLLCCGPQAAAAKLESSKIFCKSFLGRHGIATAQSLSFDDYAEAVANLDNWSYPLVIKADGLAAGKGVIIAEDYQTAQQALHGILVENRFGCSSVLIEQFLEGEEVSFIVLTDGKTIVPMATAQDHKKRDDGDQGPNTGGMGAYSPAPLVNDSLHHKIMTEVIEPTIAGLAVDGIDYNGFLYAGLMIDGQGKPWVLEYNCRLGDPETQALMMRIEGGLYQALLATAGNELTPSLIDWKQEVAICVVLAAQGYPESYQKNIPIELGTNHQNHSKVFHGGTSINKEGIIVTNGGRVLGITSIGTDLVEARNRAYTTISGINWPGKFCRQDIGHRAMSACVDQSK